MYKNEVWKDIPGYEGRYQASNYGRIRSMDMVRVCSYGSQTIHKGKVLKCTPRNDDYVRLQLTISSNVHKNKYVHCLVWEAFNGPIPEGYEVNHINEDKTDNRLENLCLMTHTENMNWGTCIERARITRNKNGKKCKPIIQKTIDGDYVSEYASITEAARKNNYSCGNIYSCLYGKYRQAYGYIWEFKLKDNYPS